MAAKYFPPAMQASADGLLCVGGNLSAPWLLDAYRHGIFPWPFWEDEPMMWWSPDPRAILPLESLNISRRLSRTIRSNRFQATCNTAFKQVLEGCAIGPNRSGGTWLIPEMIEAYVHLHQLGYAHSIEVWHDGQLAGGTYGVAIGGLFAAESMFYRIRDASKVALVYLVAHLRHRGYQLLDIQQWTPHTGRLGAIEISRKEYLQRLAAVVDLPVTIGEHLEGEVD
jgi:leucyl/phenylalanyl-tRNA--protein transferase